MRVLVATVTAGGGHLAAAAALHKAWQASYPQDTVEQLDLSDLFSPANRKLHRDGYLKLVNRAPELWGAVFKTTDNMYLARRLSRLRRLVPTGSRLRFLSYLRRFQPDLLLCTHYLPIHEARSRRVAGFSGSPTRPPAVVSVVTDFETHALWTRKTVDLYCVAAESTRAGMIRRGVPAEKIRVTGIPIRSSFTGKLDRAKLRSLLKLDGRPVLLMLGGGFGVGPLEELLEQIERFSPPLQIVVVAGKNEDLKSRLSAKRFRHEVRVIGFADNIHELMCVSDLIVSKPGGLTTSEALALGKPLLIFSPIPGQEMANASFLANHGAGKLLADLSAAPDLLQEMLSPKVLARMSEAARVLGRPTAAQDVVHWSRQLGGEQDA